MASVEELTALAQKNAEQLELLTRTVSHMSKHLKELDTAIKSISLASRGSARGSSKPMASPAARGSRTPVSSAGARRTPRASAAPGAARKSAGAGAESPAAAGKTHHRKDSYFVGKKKQFFPIPDWADGLLEDRTAKQPPASKLELTHVYGYNGRQRDNVFISHDGNAAIYHVAGVCVVAQLGTDNQLIYTGHNEDVSAIAVHPTEPIVASGQRDPKGAADPYICVWNYETGETLAKLLDCHQRDVTALGFGGEGGDFLVSVGGDDNHTMKLWKWRTLSGETKATPMFGASSVKGDVFAMAVNAYQHQEEDSIIEFMLVGKGVLKFGALKPGESAPVELKIANITTSTAVGTTIRASHGACFFPNGLGAIATHDGILLIAKGKEVVGHEAITEKVALGAICRTEDGFLVGDFDGVVRVFRGCQDGPEFAKVAEFTLPVAATTAKNGVRALAVSGTKGIVGTKENSLLELDLGDGQTRHITDGHADEVWGVTVHPTEGVFVTGGHDRTLLVWDPESKRPVDKSLTFPETKEQIVFVKFNHAGSQLAVGFSEGTLALVAWPSLEITASKRVAKEYLAALVWSPDDSKVFAGSWDQDVHVFSVTEAGQFSKKGRPLKGHSSSVTHLQVSKDGKTLRSVSKDYETLFWDAAAGKRLSRSDPDMEYDDWQVILGFEVRGVFEDGMDGTDINAVAVIPDQKLLACGDDFGTVSLMRWPALHNAARKKFEGHSAFVTALRFSPDGKWLVSAGGHDLAVMQWAVTAEEPAAEE